MKEQLPKQVYTNEYREQAVLLVTSDGLSEAFAARRAVLVFEDPGKLGQAGVALQELISSAEVLRVPFAMRRYRTAKRQTSPAF